MVCPCQFVAWIGWCYPHELLLQFTPSKVVSVATTSSFVLVGFACEQVTHTLGHEKASTGLGHLCDSEPSQSDTTISLVPAVLAP